LQEPPGITPVSVPPLLLASVVLPGSLVPGPPVVSGAVVLVVPEPVGPLVSLVLTGSPELLVGPPVVGLVVPVLGLSVLLLLLLLLLVWLVLLSPPLSPQAGRRRTSVIGKVKRMRRAWLNSLSG